ncbi:hypothetical protein ACQP2E_38430 [Actinoplanes sp. CA-015351]|uniref:hypothetical protein n=1 Tax=Actinoplanes sp. CA-015351 TaxID=3239897 RepID=UPI003D956C40
MIDDLLRATVRDLADESGTPHGLAARALADGQRIRRNRRTAAVSTALAAVLAVTIPFVTLLGRSDESRPLPAATVTVAPAPAFKPTEVFTGPGGVLLLGIQERTRSFALYPETGQYRQFPDGIGLVEPSPDGRYAVIWRDDSENIRIFNLRTGEYWQPPIPAASYTSWSADGSRLLVSHVKGYSIVDPARRRSTDHKVDFGQMPCLEYCQFTWFDGDTRVALPQAWTRGEEETRLTGIAIFEASSGKVSEHLPIKAMPIGEHSTSPDGRLMLVRQTRSPEQLTVVDIVTRQETAHFSASWSRFLADGSILAQNGGVLTRYAGNGTVLEKMELPLELTGRNLTFGF